MPESPYWLLTKGMKNEAEDALCKLRGKTSSGVQKELGDMQVGVIVKYVSYHKNYNYGRYKVG